jgi:hypothetical protein
MSVTKECLKQEIDSLDEPDFEQIYPLIHQLIKKCKQQKTVNLFKTVYRKPPAELAGSVKILGDIIAPVVEESDWDVLQ